MTAPSRIRDRGLSLVEVVVCVSLIGVAVVAILGALGGSLMASTQHRKHATADTLLRSAAELIIGPATAYTSCAGTSSYASVLPTDSAGSVTLAIETVEHWTGTGAFAFSTSCASDKGAQRITIKATGTDGRTPERIQFVKRRLTSGSGGPGVTTTSTTIVAPTTSRALGIFGSGSKLLTVTNGMTLTIDGDPIVTSASNKWPKASKKSTIKITGSTTLSAADPLAALAYPSTTGLTVYTDGAYHGPGIYRTLPLTISSTRALATGTYIVEEGLAITGGTITSASGGVLIFNGCPSATCTNTGTFSIGAGATVTLSPLSSGAYANTLLFQHRSNTSPATIAGGTTADSLNGRLYLPQAKLDVTTTTSTLTLKGLLAMTAAFSGPSTGPVNIGPST